MPRHVATPILLLTASCAVAGAAAADVYQYRDRDGSILLTDQWMPGLKLLKRYSIARGRSGSGAALQAMTERRRRFAPLIEQAAGDARLAPALVHAVVRAESAYRADAVSPKGAVGLMQLMPETAARYGVADRRDPAQNLRGGTRYLSDLLDLFDEDLRLALAAYNAGEQAVMRYDNNIPPFAETQQYVVRVMALFGENGGDPRLAQR
jgi:soluble lytic murein transglycosylase-like protein